ncbi:type II secretion system F family protein [Pseudorhodoplanes sinuspersici]|uniref:Pilus assembly protein n=1 Tax=Pseudorhodoplanes sinuspersici TaxID=1235591 RepID=A0A1W6ZNH4_9HYPH|nr:type II secretion system F family protein [Pseudorhodoplanes sinuspersici]ARP98787.1 pilus assembly protein [Pseudorhodoplanes sinuspersici]RKE69595.1 tight adherence protein B [Pseudorhodoplanes sinuspersici]
MFGELNQTLLLFILAAIAVGGLAWVFVYPILSGERAVEKRTASVAQHQPAQRIVRGSQKTRREQVEESLKELEQKEQKNRRLSLSQRISQAGLTWSKRQYILVSAGFGIVAFLTVLGMGLGLLPALGLGFAASFGLPYWMLSWLKKRRENRFLDVFPDAVDVIVRGIKSGLPLADSLRMIAAEGQEPVKSEFKTILETQAIGIPLGEACQKLYERIPLPEANFFGIVISIQQKAGGNLSEALGNLSKVLRDRKKMKAKIQAMSMEAKASAAIIGSLPPAVMGLVWMSSPKYIELLWTHPTGQLMLLGSAVWMIIGCLVMKKMINFDF